MNKRNKIDKKFQLKLERESRANGSTYLKNIKITLILKYYFINHNSIYSISIPSYCFSLYIIYLNFFSGKFI